MVRPQSPCWCYKSAFTSCDSSPPTSYNSGTANPFSLCLGLLERSTSQLSAQKESADSVQPLLRNSPLLVQHTLHTNICQLVASIGQHPPIASETCFAGIEGTSPTSSLQSCEFPPSFLLSQSPTFCPATTPNSIRTKLGQHIATCGLHPSPKFHLIPISQSPERDNSLFAAPIDLKLRRDLRHTCSHLSTKLHVERRISSVTASSRRLSERNRGVRGLVVESVVRV